MHPRSRFTLSGSTHAPLRGSAVLAPAQGFGDENVAEKNEGLVFDHFG